MRCSGCGQFVSAVHDSVERWVRDLSVFDATTHLLTIRRRVLCPTCGPKLEQLPWLEKYARVTSRLAESVARFCQVLPVRLQELLDANQALMAVCVLKSDLKRLWDFRSAKAALRFWGEWYQRVLQSKVAPLIRFAKLLKPYLSGVIPHSLYPLHTSLLEGINNKIKVIKRMPYGFLDDEYFFLKIRSAFSGIGRWTKQKGSASLALPIRLGPQPRIAPG